MAKDKKSSVQVTAKAPGGTEKEESVSKSETRPQLAEEIKHGIEPLLQKGQTEKVMSVVQAVLLRENFSGPLPHPRHFAAYEDILPGSAERIFQMAEKAQNHNADMDRTMVAAQIDDQKRGMNYGMFALLAILVLAAIFAFRGNNVAAALFLGTGVLGVIGKFITSRLKSNGQG